MTCANCGAELREGAMFCGECGARVSQALQYSPAIAQPTVPLQPLVWSSTEVPPDPVPAAITFDDFEATILAPRRSTWSLSGPDGVAHPIRLPTVIGRAPQRLADRDDVEVLPLVDPTKSLSKSHALLELDGDGLTIRDLGSTNGILLVDETNREVMLPVDIRVPVVAGTRFELGDFVLIIDRG